MGKQKGWKRVARGPMTDKGDCHHTDMDHDLLVTKRPQEFYSEGELTVDTTMKRPKLSVSHDVTLVFPAEVGDDQPRQAL